LPAGGAAPFSWVPAGQGVLAVHQVSPAAVDAGLGSTAAATAGALVVETAASWLGAGDAAGGAAAEQASRSGDQANAKPKE
jgi:hypothetical protein